VPLDVPRNDLTVRRERAFLVSVALPNRPWVTTDPLEEIQGLAEAAGAVVERRQLMTRVWGPEYYGDERMLDVYVRRVRKKIEPDPNAPMYLHTVWGVGYRLAEEPRDGEA
jgi:DNA-binding response OmpR family regulator